MKKNITYTLIILSINLQRLFNNENFLEDQELLYNIRPNVFGYPSQIIVHSNTHFKELSEKKNKLKIVYYSEQLRKDNNFEKEQPFKRFLVYSLDLKPKKYIGIEILMKGWPRYSMRILDIVESNDLNAILKDFKMEVFEDQDFYKYYEGVQDQILLDPKFQKFMEKERIIQAEKDKIKREKDKIKKEKDKKKRIKKAKEDKIRKEKEKKAKEKKKKEAEEAKKKKEKKKEKKKKNLEKKKKKKKKKKSKK